MKSTQQAYKNQCRCKVNKRSRIKKKVKMWTRVKWRVYYKQYDYIYAARSHWIRVARDKFYKILRNELYKNSVN